MDFYEGQPIYVQMAERLCDEILAGRYVADGRVPGVRDYAALLEVNVNTAVRSYDLLSRRGIIRQRRGQGYFVCPEAVALIGEERRERFRSFIMPDFFRHMRQLGVTIEEVDAAWRQSAEEE